jgi:hypothetical protein
VRTTLSIDDDIARKLQAAVRKTGLPFKAIVNSMLRAGLAQPLTPPKRKPFKVRAAPLGLRPGLSFDNIEELLDLVDGPMRG